MKKLVDKFIIDLKCKGYVEGTVKVYTRYLQKFLEEVKKSLQPSQKMT